jgi:hypothetical protein
MTFALVFWILMLLWLVFGLWGYWTRGTAPYFWYGHGGFLFVLFLLLGWHTFGPPIHP